MADSGGDSEKYERVLRWLVVLACAGAPIVMMLTVRGVSQHHGRMLSPEAGVSFGVLFGKSGSTAFALSGVYTNSGRMDYSSKYHVRPKVTENGRLAINCKSRSNTDRDREMVLYLDDKKEPWGQIPHWDRALINREKIVNCRSGIYNNSLYKFTFKSSKGIDENQHEVLIENKDCEKVLHRSAVVL